MRLVQWLAAALVLWTNPVLSQVTMTYQGQLKDAGGQEINAAMPIQFKLYTEAAGGDAIWQETHEDVEVVDGHFSVVLGSRTPFTSPIASQRSLFLGIILNEDEEMSPRLRVGSSLRAQWSAIAEHAYDVRGEHIHPAQISIGDTPVIDDTGRWVGEPTGLTGPAGADGPAGISVTNAAIVDGHLLLTLSNGLQVDAGRVTGAPGPRGQVGPDGRQGERGPAGPPGPEGNAGPLGPVGPEGPAGPQGALGPQGIPGPAGPAGPAGAPGNHGLAGSTGPTGEPGPRGEQGARGPIGPAGPIGEEGAVGLRGPVGPTGPQGAQGPAGPQGAPGADGMNGENGEPGAAGPAGPQGIAGPPGARGAVGATGPRGPQGPAGDVGPAGPAGDPGPAGANGTNGPIGPTGPRGPEGQVGLRGLQGPQGMPGPQGNPGATGPTGAPGPTGPAGIPGPPGNNAWVEGDDRVATESRVGIGFEDGEMSSQLDLRCVLGQPCMEVRYGNIRLVGGGSWHGGNPDNASLLFDLRETGWGLGNKVIRVVDRFGEETFSVTHGGRMKWTPQRTTHSFCDQTSPALVPDSEDAIFCALGTVDDDSPQGQCSVWMDENGNWLHRTGGDCGANSCEVICLK